MDKQLAETLAGWRRHLHAHPELSLNETGTAAFVCEKLREMGIPFVAGVGGTGVVATISKGASNRSVGLRADMDALPIAEATGLGYASTNPGAVLGLIAIFGGVSSFVEIEGYLDALLMVAAIMGGSFCYWLVVSRLISGIRHTLDEARMAKLGKLAGLVLIGFGCLLIGEMILKRPGLLRF